jgi:type IV secretion system protein VirB9
VRRVSRLNGHALVLSLLTALLVAGSAARGEEAPRVSSGDPRVRFVNYNEWQVYSVPTTMRAVLIVELSADEVIRNVALGDTVPWEVSLVGNLLFVKQREDTRGTTNGVMVTMMPDGKLRTYQFALRGEMGEPSVVKIKFLYPGQEAERRNAAEAVTRDKVQAAQVNAEIARDAYSGTPNYRYSESGVADFAPSDAWDNGRVTAFRFAGQTEVPAIYAVDKDGEERLVQFSMQGDVAVAGVVAPAWRLRIGPRVVCVWNEAYAPARAPSGGGTAGETFTRTVKLPRE